MWIGSLREPSDRLWKRSVLRPALASSAFCSARAAPMSGVSARTSTTARIRLQRPGTLLSCVLSQHRLHLAVESQPLGLHLDGHACAAQREPVTVDRDRRRRHHGIRGALVHGAIGLYHVVTKMDLDATLDLHPVHLPSVQKDAALVPSDRHHSLVTLQIKADLRTL